ncbi:MAG: sugar phosphate isomerase/epimerase [Chitinophagaceae bacterium]|nr:sugar phosphate isomerase/epimerase [Chitinophagaceae bacterium]
MTFTRRNFIKQMSTLAVATGTLSSLPFRSGAFSAKKRFFEISLAEWSLHKTLFSKKITNLDFPGIAKKEFGISVVEYVNQFFKDKANDTGYLNELLKRCKDNGVKNHLIMIDGEGGLADLDDAKRMKTVENHYKWVDAAKYLGCSTIRVNSYGEGSAEDVQKAAIDGLGKLGEYGAKAGINIIVENHGGYSSNGMWLAGVMKGVNMKNVGTLPDFGNFCIKRANGKCEEEYDRYKGVAELMPFAKGASAKTYDFDAQGNCIETDYLKMMKIVKDSGFKGYVGIEYEGSNLDETEGIKKTKTLLEKILKTI